MRKKSYEEVKAYIEGFGYELLSTEYVRAKEKLKMRCPKGHICFIVWNAFQQGQRCSKCKGGVRHSYEDIKKYIESFNYKILSNEYKNNHTKLILRCPKNHEFKMDFGHFKREQRCPICQGVFKYTIEEVKEYIKSFEYELLSTEYKNTHSKLKVKCFNNHEYEVTFHNFQQGYRCPICNISKGEQRIIDWLDNNNIEYIYDQPYFKDLLSPLGNPLRPDFILPDYKIWIEYDGEFHFNKYYEEQNFEAIQIHDKLKDSYAKEKGWELIRIPYWEFEEIENILEKGIKEVI